METEIKQIHHEDLAWVHKVDLHAWDNASPVHVPMDLVVPTQIHVNIKSLIKVHAMLRDAIVPKDPVLLFYKEGRYLIRDGHHRYVDLLLAGQTYLPGLVAS